MTISEFRSRDDFREAWAEAWKQPFMAAGLAALVEHGLPRTEAIPPGVDPLTVNALRNTLNEGYYQAIKCIALLGNRLPVKQADLPMEWDYLKGPPA